MSPVDDEAVKHEDVRVLPMVERPVEEAIQEPVVSVVANVGLQVSLWFEHDPGLRRVTSAHALQHLLWRRYTTQMDQNRVARGDLQTLNKQ